MCEKMQEQKIEKIKASSVDVIVERIDGKPYYSIKYFDLSENQGYIGFGSYYLDYVFEWKDKYFDIVEEDKECKNIISNDLISRKALMVAINTDFYEHFTAHHDSDQTALIDMVMQDIEEIPTAYDVDAVCEEIQKQSDYASDNIMTDKNHEMYWDGREDGLDEALEIVRNGGKKE